MPEKPSGEVSVFLNHKTDREVASITTGLTPKQKSFALHVGAGVNLVEAYLAAGYTGKSYQMVRKLAHELMDNKRVAEVAKETREANHRRYVSTARNVIEEACLIAHSDIINDFTIDRVNGKIKAAPGADPRVTRAIKSAKFRQVTNMRTGEIETHVDIQMHSKDKALDLLFSSHGLKGTDLPPLDVLMQRLPPEVAVKLREILAVTDDDPLALEDGQVIDEALVDEPPDSKKDGETPPA